MRKAYKQGFCLGKFMPFHNGHKLMIDHAAATCKNVDVMLTGAEDDPIPLSTRGNWLREQYKDSNVNIIELIDYIGDTELDENGTAIDDDYWYRWVKLISRIVVSSIDAVFTNDAYGERLAKELNARWIPLDLNRDQFHVSGTKVRNNPTGYYDYLPDVVKPYYQRNIVVIGPESTGKSTLTNHLAVKFNMGLVPEYGRTLSEVRNNDLDASDFYAIIAGQKTLLHAAQSTHQNTVSDTESFTTHLFSKIYMKQRDKELESNLLYEATLDKFDLYILLKPYKEWTDDGTRILPEYEERWLFYTDLVAYLSKCKRNFVGIADFRTLDGLPDWELRTGLAEQAVSNLLGNV
jgi:NadR type nicotinamide-nucleotide adenylyltransferase